MCCESDMSVPTSICCCLIKLVLAFLSIFELMCYIEV